MKAIIFFVFLLSNTLWGQYHALEIQSEKILSNFFDNSNHLEVYLSLDGYGRSDAFVEYKEILGFNKVSEENANLIKKELQRRDKKLKPIKNYWAKDLAYSIMIIDSTSKSGWVLSHNARFGKTFEVYPIIIVNSKFRLAGSFVINRYTYKEGRERIMKLGLEVEGWMTSEINTSLRKMVKIRLDKLVNKKSTGVQ